MPLTSSGRTAPRAHLRKGLLGTLLIGAACFGAGCDSHVGIEGTDWHADSGDAAQTVTDTRTAPAAAIGGVGSVPGRPEAAAAVARWAADLRGRGLDELAGRCWTMAPRNVHAMYAEPQTILDALAGPGSISENAVTWQNTEVIVTAQDRDIATGYACPHVYPTGGEAGFNDADARHTVRRFLSRATGNPLDPADREDAYPLICAAGRTWDPDGTGKPSNVPLAVNPSKPGTVKTFVDQSIKSEWPRGGYITVSVPVTTGTGNQTKQIYTLKSGSEGYCIGDVSG
ncbi:hypothetical protein GPX89_21270 [Nocardia sp. ET3-3]|uniref:Uncharacterized protein n=1 Tax=Nocardia terrae TaxID=2675851 RepID=A0A7K1UZQ7_9NOCA|nr:hypothetical protein [Nocardia terrae]MVU79761.1 hypothetical protein [Nocardia terrae]